MSKVIMAWSKCKVEFGPTGENDAFASNLTNVGTIKNQTTTLSADDGDSLQAVATGGEIVAEEMLEGSLQLETTVIEPTDALLTALGIARTDDGELLVKTHVVAGDQSVKVTPKNAGAKGIKAPVCRISVAPAFGEDTGNELKLTFKISKTTARPEVLKKKTSNGWTTVTEGSATGHVSNESELPGSAANDTIYGVDGNYWYSRFTTTSALS